MAISNSSSLIAAVFKSYLFYKLCILSEISSLCLNYVYKYVCFFVLYK